jgi:hypothetical protein
LRTRGYDVVSISVLNLLFRLSLRWVEKPTAVPATIGNRTDKAAFSKIAAGSVNEGI